MPSIRIASFSALALALAAGCLRLGFWQLDRLSERQAANRLEEQRRAQPPVAFLSVITDSVGRAHRRVTVSGRYDYANELVLTSRGHDGSPGVHLLTPLLQTDSNATAVLVNRGWVYAPDGMTVELASWHEDSTVTIEGYVQEFSTASGPVSTPSQPRGLRRLQGDSVAARLPYRIAPAAVVATAVRGNESPRHPVRIAPPTLSDGSHRSYAIQWFAFAAIAVLGLVAVYARERSKSA